MNRAALIEAGLHVIAPRGVGSLTRTEMGRLLDVWEPTIRADERSQLHQAGWATPEQVEAMVATAKARARLAERKRVTDALVGLLEATATVDMERFGWSQGVRDALALIEGEQQ